MVKFEDHNGVVVPISGELSYTTINELNKSSRIFIKQNQKIIFDLSQVTSSDNAGIALLLTLTSFAKSLNKEILFINLPQQLLHLLTVNGLKEILPIG